MIEEALIKNAKKNPDKIAIICENKKISFKDLIKAIFFYSSYLNKIKKKTKIILSYKNSINWVIYYFAIRFSGHTPVLVSNDIPLIKIKYIISKNKIKYVISDRLIKLKNIVRLKNFINYKEIKIKANLKKFNGHEIIYTSGTTGNPKGVILSFKKSLIVASMINKVVKISSKDKEVISLPLNHSDGLGRLKCFANKGHTIVLNENPNNFGKLFSIIKKFKINGFFMVPSGIEILKKMSFLDFSNLSNSVKFIELGSEKINLHTLNWLRKTFSSASIYYHYGLTEASRAAFKVIKFGKKIPNYFKASPGVNINIINDQNKLCKKNEIGEIVINGKIIADGYVEDFPQNNFINYGFKTGDLAKFHSKNQFILIGRKDKVKKINGLSVNLKEIENEINKYPEIKNNICKFVIRQNSNNYEIKTIYQSKKKINEKKIQNFLKKRLEYFKIPRIYEYKSK